MTDRLSQSQFLGGFDREEAPMIEGGQSTYDGSIAVTLFDRSIVEKALPNGFQLASRVDGHDDTAQHPVVHMIGFQASPMLIMEGEISPAPDPGYTELILLVPYVVKAGRSRWHSFVVRMFLNDEGAILIGNSIYSYRKAFASLPQTPNGDEVSTAVWPFLENEVFKSEVTCTGPWTGCCGPAPAVPLFSDVQTLLQMPLLGAFVDGSNDPFQVVCSYWEWDFDCAQVADAESKHDFLAEAAPGTAGWIGAATSPPGSAMLVRNLRWRIPLPPQQCQF